jgi:hypothetical protein
MRLGFIILAHTDLHRVAELVRHLSAEDCSIAVHIDRNVEKSKFDAFKNGLEGTENVVFSKRTACEWGRFSLVQATLDASELLLKTFKDVSHVQLISGSCLPIRPIKQQKLFLERNTKTDFIESVSVANNFWVKDGLNEERFTLYFPFSWRKQRRLFDVWVKIQRRTKIKRKIPVPLVPHIGSQWWCLTAKTLKAIIHDPKRPYYDAYFNWSWIPDESYFQTLARLHSHNIESRSLTFSKFDYLGKPFVLYDDHLKELTLSDCFWVRKIWAGADKLYSTLLNPERANQPMSNADPKVFDEKFEAADRTRCEGGVGRFHQGRYPYDRAKRVGMSQSPYTVFVGFKALYPQFPEWVTENSNATAHGNLFARKQVGDRLPHEVFAGNLPADPIIRNRHPKGYLSNLFWMLDGEHQCFLYDLRDNPNILKALALDPMAQVVLLRHSWLLNLLNRPQSFEAHLANANRFNRIEQSFMLEFQAPEAAGRVRVIALENAVADPGNTLEQAIAHIPNKVRKQLKLMPERENVDGLDNLARKLQNHGLSIDYEPVARPKGKKTEVVFEKPYVVK